ncbi:hypothetical protein PMZ80_001830 [Knufia obscura]|uniref:UBL3-like ubiquitin domain-containing protein n=1 Tax=Knufia obscura TaxID=1635080 RepID=A0ABR0S479_9EURO|nr:hypothetical protein PMZ80_001830 [Knufia obscura]
MSSSDRPVQGNTDPSPAQDIPTRSQEDAPSSTPVELNSLQTDKRVGSPLEQSDTHKTLSSSEMPHAPMRTDTTTAIQNAQNPPTPPPVPSVPTALRDRAQSTAIGESSDSPAPVPKDTEDTGPTLMITLLLITGARHPFNLDMKYLAKRNVQVQGNDPFNLSVYKVKELILREWRDDWESKPSSPSAIRLISFGKVLDDKAAVKDLKFNQNAANVVHMSIKPQDFVEEEDAKGAKASRTHSHDGTEGRSPGCRCIIM